jgi:hypothetical protein
MDLSHEGDIYKYKFENGSEIRTVSSAYREHIAVAAGDFGDYTKDDLELARLPDSSTGHKYETKDPWDLVNVLNTFVHRTHEMIQEIPSISRIPKYDNRQIVERFDLGKKAEEMAESARKRIEAIQEAERIKKEKEDTNNVISAMESQLATLPSQLDDESSSL